MIDPLVPQSLRHALPALCTTFDFSPASIRVRARFFLRDSGVQFYAWEGQPDRGSDDFVFFGLETGPQYKHLGYMLASELSALRGPTGAQVERDTFFGKSIKDAPTLDEVLRLEDLAGLAEGMEVSARERRAAMAEAARRLEWVMEQAAGGIVVVAGFVDVEDEDDGVDAEA